MSKTIFKYPLPTNFGKTLAFLPDKAIPLTLQLQQGAPVLWCEIDTDRITKNVEYNIYGTGHRLPDDPGKYLGSWQDTSGLVYHAYVHMAA